MKVPARCHDMVGMGFPSAKHSSMTVCPSMAVVLCGATSIRIGRLVEAREKGGKKVVGCSTFIKCVYDIK